VYAWYHFGMFDASAVELLICWRFRFCVSFLFLFRQSIAYVVHGSDPRITKCAYKVKSKIAPSLMSGE
jgi:hypothetical protein